MGDGASTVANQGTEAGQVLCGCHPWSAVSVTRLLGVRRLLRAAQVPTAFVYL